MNASAGGDASRSVVPSPINTTLLYPCFSFSIFINSPLPPFLDVGSFSSNPANSPKNLFE